MYTTNMVYPEWKSEYSISPGTYVKDMLEYCDMKTSIVVGFFGNQKSYNKTKQIKNILMHCCIEMLDLFPVNLDLKLND